MAESPKAPEEDTGTWKKGQSKFSRYVRSQPCHFNQLAYIRDPVNATANTSTHVKKQQTEA